MTQEHEPTAPTTKPRQITAVGMVGCGRMGAFMAGHLLEAGWPVVAFDPSPQARDAVVELGAEPADDAASVGARSELVLVVVANDAQVREAVAGDSGLLDGARPGTVAAVCASVDPATCREVAEVAGRHDVHVIDLALVGGERGAEEGALTLMCGGDESTVALCAEALAPFATSVCVIGPVGAGQVAKTANNLLMWAAIRIDVEALRLARAYGIEPGKLRPALRVGTGANRVLAEWGRHRLRWPAKDLEVARGMADEVGVDVPLVDTLAELVPRLSTDDLRELR